MLELKGKVLEVVEETITPGPGATWSAFQSIKFMVLSGKSDILEVTAGDDLPVTSYPREGEDVTFAVKAGVSGSGRFARLRLTATSRIGAGARVAAAS